MKTTQNKNPAKQQPKTANQSFFHQGSQQAFFSERSSENADFFSPSLQLKTMTGEQPFFAPSPLHSKEAIAENATGKIPKIQRTPAFESEQTIQTKMAPEEEGGQETSEVQMQSAFSSGDGSGEAEDNHVQFRLTIGKPGDRYEQEADAVANQVVTGPKQRGDLGVGIQTKPLHKNIRKLAQRQVFLQPKRLQDLPKVQKQGDGSLKASSDVASRLESSRGRGSSLDENTQNEMESSIGANFDNVRLHTGSEAVQLNQDLGAKAFTHGSDIYFNQGQYNPNSSEGKHLLAHELTHTVQQGASIQRKVNISTGAAPSVQLLPDLLKRGINWVAERTIPGYTLLNVVLGKNLITGAAVTRSGVNLIKGYMRLNPVIGSILLAELEETKSLPEAGKWVEAQVAKFGIDFNDISRRLKLMWDEMSVWKGKSGNVAVFKKYLGPVIGKFLAFSGVVMEKVKELRFEAALRLVGAGELLDALKKNPKAFKKGVEDPKTVLKNFMVGALKQGFSKFKDNFVTHFKSALLGWLFGKAAEMGVQIPKKFDVAGLFSLIAQLVGATYQQIRAMVVKRLGPKGEMIVSKLEQTVAFIKDLVTKGPIALWERVQSFLTNLKEMVFSKIASLVSMEVIKAAVSKLLSMLNPAGALVQLAMTVYRVIKFFIDNWETIKSVAMGILKSIAMVALNNIGPAAAFVEKVLAQGMKLIIGFLARIFGLGGIVDKVKALIKKISDPVQKAIGKVIDWIVAQGKKLFRKGKAAAAKAKGKLLSWWKARKKFKAKDGKQHSLFFKGEGKAAKIYMASDIRPLDAYYNTIKNNYKKDKHGEATGGEIAKLKGAIDELEGLKSRSSKSSSTGKALKYATYNEALGRNIAAKMAEIASILSKLPGDLVGGKEEKLIRPKSKPISYPAQHTTPKGGDMNKDSVDGKLAQASILSFDIGDNLGSKAGVTAEGELYRVLDARWGITVAPGHLINHQVGGSGNTHKNLAPITKKANNAMARNQEKDLKDLVLNKNKVVRYTVAIIWPSSAEPSKGSSYEEQMMPLEIKSTISELTFHEDAHRNLKPDTYEKAKQDPVKWSFRSGNFKKDYDVTIGRLLGKPKKGAGQKAAIVKALAAAQSPLTAGEIAKRVGIRSNDVSTIVKRINGGLGPGEEYIVKVAYGTYELTERGENSLL
ncbi:MAG: DUF4157 domain-containing protein [Crocosphaera sp.]